MSNKRTIIIIYVLFVRIHTCDGMYRNEVLSHKCEQFIDKPKMIRTWFGACAFNQICVNNNKKLT